MVASLGGFALQFCLINATRKEPNAGVIAVIQTSAIFWGLIFDYALFGREFNFWNILGAVVIFASISLAIVYKKKSN